MKRAPSTLSDSETSRLSIPGVAPALQELLEQDEFTTLRATLAIYAEVLAEQAM